MSCQLSAAGSLICGGRTSWIYVEDCLAERRDG